MQKTFIKPAELLFDAVLFGYFYLLWFQSNSMIISFIKSFVRRFSVVNSWLIAGTAGFLVLLSMVMLLMKVSKIFEQYPEHDKLKWFGILYAIGAVFYMLIISPSLIEVLSVRKTDASLAILVFLIVEPVLVGIVYGVGTQLISNVDYKPWFNLFSQAFFFFFVYFFIPVILAISVLLTKIQEPHFAWMPFSALLLMRVGAIFYNQKISYLNIFIMLTVLALDLYVTVN